MKYKNIIFDFGNVIGKFKGDYILGKFASTPEDYDILADAIFKNWVALDAGTIDYDQNAEDTIAGLPDHLKDTARDFFENWFQYVDPLPETWKFIKELKARGVPIYLLSNASTRFAERALEDHPILKEFDGIVFSAPLKMAKPGHDIYYHLFNEITFCRENASLSMTRWKMSLQVKNLEWRASCLREILRPLKGQLSFNQLPFFYKRFPGHNHMNDIWNQNNRASQFRYRYALPLPQPY